MLENISELMRNVSFLLSDDYDDDTSPVVIEAKKIELQAVKKAEAGHIHEAIDLFCKCIQMVPRRPSGYNNRAQAYRLKGDISGKYRHWIVYPILNISCSLIF